MKEYTHAEYEEFARIAFYKGREVEAYNVHGEPIFKRPTFNGFLREIEALPPSECGCPKGICVGHVSSGPDLERRKLHENLIEVLCFKMGVHEDDIVPEAHMKNDLGLDSLDLVEFSMEIEKEYNFIFDDKTADTFQDWTINQLINHIEKNKE
jgi:acyl carrier protein